MTAPADQPARPQHNPALRSFFLALTDAGHERRVPPGTLPVPPGVSALHLGDDGAVRLQPIDAIHRGEAADAFFEPVEIERQPRLVFAPAAATASVMLNGVIAPPLAVLRERDEVTFLSHRLVLHVSLILRPYFGAALNDDACCFCGMPIHAGDRIYICPGCAQAAHAPIAMDSATEDTATPPRCADIMPSCPVCETPVMRAEGPSWMPEVTHG